MRRLLLPALLLLLLATASAVAAPDPARQAEQAALESGDDLSSRGQRTLFRARARQDEGDFAGAAELVRAWLAEDPGREHHLLRFNLAVSELALDQPAAAAADLEKAVAAAPRFARAWLRLGEAAYENADYARAGEAFAKAYALSPEPQAEIQYYAGASLLAAGRSAAALEALVALVTAHPARIELPWYQALVAAAVDAGQPARARPHLQRLLSAGPDDAAVWDLAYRFHAGQADYEAAAAHLTVVGYLRPLSTAEQEQLGDLYAVIGVPLQAARHYEQAFGATTEPDARAYRKLASAWLQAYEIDAARAALTKALAARPTVELWALKGDLEYAAEDYEAALAAFAAATALDDGFGRGHLMLGYCAVELDRTADARGHLERAMDFPDQAGAARSLLARLATPE